MQIWKNIDFSVLSSFLCSFSAYSKNRIVLHKNFNIFLCCLLEWISFHSQEVGKRRRLYDSGSDDDDDGKLLSGRYVVIWFARLRFDEKQVIVWNAEMRKKQFLFQAISRSSPSKARHITSTGGWRLKWMETISHFFKLIKSIGPLFAEIYSIFTFTGLGRSVIQRWFATGHNESLIKTVIWCKTF